MKPEKACMCIYIFIATLQCTNIKTERALILQAITPCTKKRSGYARLGGSMVQIDTM